MAKKIILIIVFLFSTAIIQAQTLTEQEKQEIIYNLRNADIWDENSAQTAIDKVIGYRISEALPEIERYFEIQNRFIKARFLDALDMFGSTRTIEFAYSFFNSMDMSGADGRGRIFLNGILLALFHNNDFSKYQLAFDELEEDKPLLAGLQIVLREIAINIPEAREEAKIALERVAVEHHDLIGWNYISSLDEAFGEENIPFLIDRVKEDKENNRLIIKHLFNNHKSNLIEEFIKEWVFIDTNYAVKRYLIDALIYNYNTIENYKFITGLMKSAPETFDEYALTSYSRNLDFIRMPDSTVTTLTILDSLTSYTNQSYGYEWLKDEAYKNELLNKLTNAKTKLIAGDSLGCRTEVATFQNSVNQVYQDSSGSYPKYVSNAGYKFMYHYAQYILDRLPEGPTTEGLPVKLLDSQGNLLQGGYLQYYEGGWQDATSNGDGTFVVQTDRSTISLKMHYANAENNLVQDLDSSTTVVFSTVNTTVQLKDCQGYLLNGGIVQ